MAIRAFPPMKQTSIKVMTDNTTALSYVRKQGGTRSEKLSRLAGRLWKYCISHQIALTAQHIPGIQNTLADAASRNFANRTRTWTTLPSTFQRIQNLFGANDVDLFADRLTHLLPQYVSWRYDPNALAADAMSINWTTFINPVATRRPGAAFFSDLHSRRCGTA